MRVLLIDGKLNKMRDAIVIKDCPIKNASFLPYGSQVIVAGRRKFFLIVLTYLREMLIKLSH